MKGIDYNSSERIAKNCKFVKYGSYTTTVDEDDNPITKPIKTIDEFTFYKIYLELNNVIRWGMSDGEIIDMKTSEAPIELLAHIMTKDEDYTLLYRNKDSKLSDLGKELERSDNSIYASINRLRKAAYLIKNEDNFFIPNKELRDLTKQTKNAIKVNGFLSFDYLFKFCIK